MENYKKMQRVYVENNGIGVSIFPPKFLEHLYFWPNPPRPQTKITQLMGSIDIEWKLHLKLGMIIIVYKSVV